MCVLQQPSYIGGVENTFLTQIHIFTPQQVALHALGQVHWCHLIGHPMH
jgi:hypothetical protein